MKDIPLIEVSGSHRQVGRQIGEQAKDHINWMVESQRAEVPPGVGWEDMLYQGNLYLAHSRAIYPQYVEELEGYAEGAEVSFPDLFLCMCEELWEAAAWSQGAPRVSRGCTDFAARGRATLSGHTLLAHTNDLSPDFDDRLMITKVQAGNEPQFLAVSPGGAGISAGYNSAGISLTGNQLYNNDIRPGIPRGLMVRAILAARRLGEAMDACLVPQRASNYNNLIADSDGEIYSMEGSATDCEPLYIEGDILAHANHYTSPIMRRFEQDRNSISGSVIRYNRALRLLRENYGKLTPQLLQKLMADHVNYPNSICAHGKDTVTSFSMVIDLNELCAWIGPGQPCQTKYKEYRLEAWKPQLVEDTSINS
jgi:isopenicillin-N N-acyltransferase-like protein